jgi:hypothetical protein
MAYIMTADESGFSLSRPHHQYGPLHHASLISTINQQRTSEEGKFMVSEVCNILFTRELARRLQGTGVTANCLHPGFVATRFGDQSGGLISRLIWLAKFFAISPAQGAETIIYLASSPDVAKATGQYFYKSVPIRPSSWGQDDRSALLLWQRSAALAGMNE